MKDYRKIQIELTDRKMKQMIDIPGEKIKEMDLHIYRYIEYIEWMGSYINKDMRILDIGCRDGAFLTLLREKTEAWKLYGVEINETASMLAGDRGIKVYNIDAHDMTSLESNYFDLVCLTHFLEHTHNPKKILNDVVRILKPKGLIFIEVPLEPRPSSHPTDGGHFHTFQRPQDLNDMLEVFRGSGYRPFTVKQKRDNKKNKWYRILVRKNMIGKKI